MNDQFDQPPQALLWLKIYSVFMGFIYLAVVALFASLVFFLDSGEVDPIDLFTFFIVGVMCLVFGAAHFAAVLIDRQKWGFPAGLAVICIGLTSCATWPITIPLLVYWLKPETKAWFQPADPSVFR